MFFGTGFLINSYITYLEVTTGTIQWHYPLLVLGVLLLIMRVQFVCTGLLGELISKSTRRESGRYVIRAQLSRYEPPAGFTVKKRNGVPA
ncbi:MAG: hypothetical protein HY815_33935 [Candidatus Riflebacteria bacterium]|nr:hypothetical protein [Candidatus Riflebacteria bacterium]